MRALHAAVCLLAAGAALPTSADVVTDGTAGARGRLDGPDFQIGADLGTRAGRNLFHSFERFSLNAGERATFSGPDQIRRVISRVTGGARSDVDGTIRSTIPGADFYFLNPSGVVFGPNAQLEVQGSFHVSTARELRFTDGAVFSARAPSASSFTVASPEAFGFVGRTPAGILLDAAGLVVGPGKTLTIAAGAIDARSALLAAPSGTVSLAAGTAPWPLRRDHDDGAFDGEAAGPLELSDRTIIAVGGDAGGTVRIRAGRFVLADESRIDADNTGPRDAHGGIEIKVEEARIDTGASLTADARGVGRGGTLAIRAETLAVTGGASLSASTFNAGDAGGIRIEAGDLDVRGTAQTASEIRSDVRTGANGAGGSIVIDAENLNVRERGLILAQTFDAGGAGSIAVRADRALIAGTGGRDQVTGILGSAERGSLGDAGSVSIQANRLELRSGGEIRSSTFGRGDGGSVQVKADRLIITGPGLAPLTGISSSVGEESGGAGGTVTVRARDLALRADGKIRSVTFAEGDAGTVVVASDRVSLESGGQISSSTLDPGTGASGDVRLSARDSISVVGQSAFVEPASGVLPPSGVFASTESSAADASDAGSATVAAPRIALMDRGEIASESFGGGDGGEVTVEAPRLLTIDNAEITTKTERAGDGGAIVVRAGALELRNAGLISSASEGAGAGGSVVVEAERATLESGARISAEGTGDGPAGDVTVIVGDRLELAGASVTTNSSSAGGGEIQLMVGDLIDLRNGRVTTSVARGRDPTAGNIAIDPAILIIDSTRIEADAPEGFGGKVRIVADNILVPGGNFEALLARREISATGGDPTRDGTVVVDAPDVDLTGGLVVLENAFVDVARLRERCATRKDVGASSFTAVGRDGLPPGPDNPLVSFNSGMPTSVEANAGAAWLVASAALLPCSRAPESGQPRPR